MTDSLMKQKLVQYFNEALAMENAAVDRNQYFSLQCIDLNDFRCTIYCELN